MTDPSMNKLLVRAALTGDGNEDDASAIESMGDPAFEWLLGTLGGGGLSSAQRVACMQLMSRLTRHFCVKRKLELLNAVLAVALTESADPASRSAAVKIAIFNAALSDSFRDPSAVFGGLTAQEVRTLVATAVRRALALGLEEDARALTVEYLARSAV